MVSASIAFCFGGKGVFCRQIFPMVNLDLNTDRIRRLDAATERRDEDVITADGRVRWGYRERVFDGDPFDVPELRAMMEELDRELHEEEA